MIRFKCSNCTATLAADDHKAGGTSTCPDCKKTIRVPGPVPVVLEAAPVVQAVQPLAVPQFRCPYCQNTSPPVVKQQVSAVGWIVFIILLLACFPLCIIGIFIKEQVRYCSACGVKLG